MEWLILLLLFGMAGRKRSDSPVPTSPLLPIPTVPGTGLTAKIFARIESLKKRAAGGDRWVERFAGALAANAPDMTEVSRLQIARALGRWAGIESGGNPMAKSKLNEIGLLQIGTATLADMIKAGLLTKADEAAMKNPATGDAQHADIAVRFFLGSLRAVKRKAPSPDHGHEVTAWDDPLDLVWAAKVQHSLPAFLSDLSRQGILGNNRGDAHKNYPNYRPTPPASNFAQAGMTPADGLLFRFFPPADVVADGANAGNVS